MKRIYLPIVILCMAFAPVAMFAADAGDNTDEFTRLNPSVALMDDTAAVAVPTADNPYPYIRRDLNHIELNGDSWDELKNKLEQSRTHASFVVAHIGDSHIQGDSNTGTTRRLIQNEYGDAGRGIIIPFKIAGTNEPRDYKILSTTPFVIGKMMKRPRPVPPVFTGITLSPRTSPFSFDISVLDSVSIVNVLCSGDAEIVQVVSQGHPVGLKTSTFDGGVRAVLDNNVSSFTITLTGDNVDVYGFDLRNDNPGVVYHAVGNNGASYATYNSVNGFGSSLSSVDPDLIIISLGTNEAFGNFVDQTFIAQVDRLVQDVRKHNPHAKILLTTPSECQRSVKGTKGGKTYKVNTNVARARHLILDYGKAHNIPTYDFYNVAGGDGASALWLNDKLLSSDRIHRTRAGYELDGQLFYEALVDALGQQ